jgi:hypothetical protein
MVQEMPNVASPEKSAALPAAVQTLPPKPVRAKRAVLTAASVSLEGEDRQLLIAEAAYFRAERRGFQPGRELEDWLAAEIEVDALLGEDNGRA